MVVHPFKEGKILLTPTPQPCLRVMVEWFAEVYRRGGLKVSAGKSKVMPLNREEELECEVHVDRIRLEHLNIWGLF